MASPGEDRPSRRSASGGGAVPALSLSFRCYEQRGACHWCLPATSCTGVLDTVKDTLALRTGGKFLRRVVRNADVVVCVDAGRFGKKDAQIVDGSLDRLPCIGASYSKGPEDLELE